MAEHKISNEMSGGRLFEKDTRYIKKKVQTDGRSDTRFKDKASALRHYVRIGIATEQRTEAAHSLNDKTIKSTQKEVIDETLVPLKKSIDNLSERLELYEEKQKEYFSESNKNAEQLKRKLDALKDDFSNNFKFELVNIFEKILTDTLNQSELMRNIIVIRTILYVFLLGTKASRIDSTKITDWQKIVTFAHRRASELYSQELTNSNDPNFENNVVGKLSGELFNEISKQIKNANLI